MHLGVILGLLVATGSLLGAVLLEGGRIAALLNLPGALIVFGGTAGVLLVTTPAQELRKFPALLGRALFGGPPPFHATARQLVSLAEQARREGLLSLDAELPGISDPYLRRGLTLVVDGLPPEEVAGVLAQEQDLMEAEAAREAGLFTTAGGYAPTLGIIGTVMGLVHVLGNLSEPSELSSAIATAFLATFYGVASANLFWLPLGGKLTALANERAVYYRMVATGILAIQQGERPAVLEQKLSLHYARGGPGGPLHANQWPTGGEEHAVS